MKYCPECKRNVKPTKNFNWIVFILLGGVFYLLFYMFKKKRCPICGCKDLRPAKVQASEAQD